MMKKTNKHSSEISLTSLIGAAKKGNWQLVDENLPSICNDSSFIDWALKKGVGNPNGDLRDLAVSILEKSKHELKPDEINKLQELMETDKNPYVQFRSAFVLFNHDIKTPAVIQKLHSAVSDGDVGQIAQGYLRKLK